MTDQEVEACLARCRKGDEQAVLALFHYMYPHVTKWVWSNLPAKESAEDLISRSCTKAIANLHQFSGKVPFLHWVSRITVNTCLNQIRYEKHRPEIRLGDLSEEEAGVVERLAVAPDDLDSAGQFAARELVEKLLAGLKPQDRLVMRLLYLEGRSVDEISKTLGWNASLVKMRAFRARAILRKRYAVLMKENV